MKHRWRRTRMGDPTRGSCGLDFLPGPNRASSRRSSSSSPSENMRCFEVERRVGEDASGSAKRSAPRRAALMADKSEYNGFRKRHLAINIPFSSILGAQTDGACPQVCSATPRPRTRSPRCSKHVGVHRRRRGIPRSPAAQVDATPMLGRPAPKKPIAAKLAGYQVRLRPDAHTPTRAQEPELFAAISKGGEGMQVRRREQPPLCDFGAKTCRPPSTSGCTCTTATRPRAPRSC